jgi:hypothetical protein
MVAEMRLTLASYQLSAIRHQLSALSFGFAASGALPPAMSYQPFASGSSDEGATSALSSHEDNNPPS